MGILILLIILILATVGVAILYLVYRLNKVKGELFGATQEATRARSRQERAKKAAEAAEQRCEQLLVQIGQSMSHTGEALNIAQQIEEVHDDLHELTEYIFHPMDAPSSSGRHARPGEDEYALPDAGEYAEGIKDMIRSAP